MSQQALLFDISPEENTGKRKSRKKTTEDSSGAAQNQVQAAAKRFPVTRYLASLDDVPCPQCGCPADLVEPVIVKGRTLWKVQCGWWCLTEWLVKPIPGILDASQESEDYVIPEGQHAGKKFSELPLSHVQGLASHPRYAIRVAAEAWLAKKQA